jgi:hypothetical protein
MKTGQKLKFRIRPRISTELGYLWFVVEKSVQIYGIHIYWESVYRSLSSRQEAMDVINHLSIKPEIIEV